MKFLLVCALIAIGGYAIYALIFPTERLRYRLTLDVDVDGVTHTGSGVVEIAYQPLPDMFDSLPGGHFRGEMRGYAVTVDLGERGVLFALDGVPMLASPETNRPLFPEAAYFGSLPFVAYRVVEQGPPSHTMQQVRQLRKKTGAVDVPLDMLPMLLRFRDINDPQSNEEVDPRDLAAAFGPGVRLLDAKLEFTDDPVSSMPRNWPRWLVDEKGEEGFRLRASHNGKLFGLFWWCSSRFFKGTRNGRFGEGDWLS